MIRLFTLAESLGGVELLVELSSEMTHERVRCHCQCCTRLLAVAFVCTRRRVWGGARAGGRLEMWGLLFIYFGTSAVLLRLNMIYIAWGMH